MASPELRGAGSTADDASSSEALTKLLDDAQRAYEEGELGEALSGFEAVLAREPGHVEALVGRGVIRATTQDMDGALEDLDQAIEAEAQAQAICMAHPDFREAHDARVEKRTPVFKDFSE